MVYENGTTTVHIFSNLISGYIQSNPDTNGSYTIFHSTSATTDLKEQINYIKNNDPYKWNCNGDDDCVMDHLFERNCFKNVTCVGSVVLRGYTANPEGYDSCTFPRKSNGEPDFTEPCGITYVNKSGWTEEAGYKKCPTKQ